ncbi:DUF6446 family protein [Paracoccus sp. TK19116]|uniref:DUF6446 family protein n=1 Tax=Paracoccus albicereus TaxID=2922394 RepID=A0ABT1MS18_9RHOB|nr:DUF6446 family protein [Paracoccus albicereus]MCQ0969676.1 DUF6446 family protein [Paracoccus albicereus]
MNWGRIAVIAIAASAIIGGAGLYYLQVYGFYSRIDPEGVELTAAIDGDQIPLPIASFEGIDATSSPLRWRACAHLATPVDETTLTPYPDATPLNGPGWFDCYDAGHITEDLASGAATAYLGTSEIRPDVDRVIAIYPDGRAFGWHQYNDKDPERGVMD